MNPATPIIRNLFAFSTVFAFVSSSLAANKVWAPGTTDFNLTTNWTGGLPGTTDNAYFTGAAGIQPTLTGGITIQGLTFSSAASSGYTLSSSTGSLTLTNVTAASLAISAANTSGTNTISAPIILGGAAGSSAFVTQAAGGTLVLSGNISSTNTSGLLFNGNGLVIISGNNTYTGQTSIGTQAVSSGTVQLQGAGKLGSGVLNMNTGTLDLNGTTQSVAGIVSQAVTGSTANLLIGSGTLNLGGDVQFLKLSTNNPNGATISGIGGGVLNLNTGNRIFTIQDSTATSAELTISAIIADGSASSAMLKSGDGTLVLTGANTFTGRLNVSAGTVSVSLLADAGLASSIGKSSAAADSLVLGNGTLEYTGTSVSSNRSFSITAGTTGTIAVTNASTNLTMSGTTSATTGSLTKAGAGTLTLSAAHLYTGATTVSAGTLVISAGNINSSAVTVAAGAKFVYNSNVARTGAVSLNGSGSSGRAILSGVGTINMALALDNIGDTLSPGNSPGTQNFAVGQSWNSFTYLWETNNFTGTTAGTDFDQISIAGSLALTGTEYVLDLTSLTASNVAGDVGNFSDVDRSWTILTSTGLTGFSASNWTIATTNFTSSPAASGTWGLAQSGNDLVLSYTAAVPEPSTCAMLGFGMTAAIAIFRSRRRRTA